MKYILEKYKKYDLSYNFRKGILYINKKMPVKDFVQLKKDIRTKNIYLSNIIIEN